MNSKEQLIALELEMVYARSAGNTEKLRALEVQHNKVTVAVRGRGIRPRMRNREPELTGLRRPARKHL